MTNTDYYFVLGFVIAGVFGFLVSFLLKRWKTVDETQQWMFSKPPIPGMKTLTGNENKGVWGLVTKPDQSPIKVLTSGCITIFAQIIFLLGTVVLIGVLFYVSPLENYLDGVIEGIIFAAIVGFIFQTVRVNWKKTTMLYKKIVNPPNPTPNFFSPPNRFPLAANPAAPAFTVVIQSTFEILWRAVLIGIMFFLLYFAFAEILPILRAGIFQSTSASPFQL